MRDNVLRGKARCRFVTGTNDQNSTSKPDSNHTGTPTQIGSYTTEYRFVQSEHLPDPFSRRKKRRKRSGVGPKPLPLTLQQQDTVLRVIAGTMLFSGHQSSNAHTKTRCPFCRCQVRVTRLKRHLTKCPNHSRDTA